MAERTADVQAHWTRPGVLARLDAALTELGHDPQKLTPEILATVEHLHSGGLATTREQAKRIALTEDSRVLDVGGGIGGPARYLARTYGCRVDGIDLTPELIETGRVLTGRCGLADRVVLQIGNELDLPYSDQTFDVVWCQNVTMNIADKDGLFAGVYRVLKPGGLFTSTEYSVGPGGDIIFPVPWAYDASINFLDREDVMRARYHTAGFRILESARLTFAQQSAAVVSAAEKLSSRHVLPRDLSNALKQLDDGELDRLVAATRLELQRRGRLLTSTEQRAPDQSTPTEESPERRQPEEPNVALTQGQVNAVRATFKAGVITFPHSETIRDLLVRCAQGAGV